MALYWLAVQDVWLQEFVQEKLAPKFSSQGLDVAVLLGGMPVMDLCFHCQGCHGGKDGAIFSHPVDFQRADLLSRFLLVKPGAQSL